MPLATRYPIPPQSDIVDDLHGVAVADPYRPLEQAGAPATIAWVDAENALTRATLDGPSRQAIVERLRQLHRYARVSAPIVRGSRVFFTENDGTQNQPRLVMEDGDGRTTLVDPNALDEDGTTALTTFEPDEQGRRIVYALSRHGSDRQELRVHDAGGGVDLPDCLQWVKFASIAWRGDGFFYTRYPEPGTVPAADEQYFCQVWFHRLGETQGADRLVYHRPDQREIVFDVDVTSDGRQVVITSRPGASDNAEIHVLDTAALVPRALVTGFEHAWHFAGGVGGRLFFRTDAGAAFGRVVMFDLAEEVPAPREVVGESAHTLSMATLASGGLLVSRLEQASDRLAYYDLDGMHVSDISLPDLGTIVGIGAGFDTPTCRVTFTSFTMPPRLLACDLRTGRAAIAGASDLPFDPARYVTEQVWYRSNDGTRVSMFLVRRDEVTGPAPVLLSGYGGFNISLTPTFDPSDFVWLDAGGVLAVANLRGGGEYGEAWHRAGMREHKQNVFDDFIAAAEWLLASGRAAPGRIAIEGGSNGGLLVGAAMVQRPDLYGAVVCRVPVADMLRYHLFTVGRFWIPEYGSADDAEQFAWLLPYSPYHNVRDDVAYPPTLVMTADTDDRVDPGMAKKFAARLQAAATRAGGGPVLLRVEHRAGHGAGKPISKQIDEQADFCAFLFSFLTGTPRNEQH